MRNRNNVRRALMAAASGVAVVGAGSALGQSINYSGGPYLQNFDSLTNVTAGSYTSPTTASLFDLSLAPVSPNPAANMAGWTGTRGTGSGTMVYQHIDGSANVAGLLGSAGIAGTNAVTDRALVSQSTSGNANAMFGLVLINNTALAYTTADISFAVELWRRNGQSDDAGNQNFVGNNFSYLVGAANSTINSAGFTNVPTLDWKRPNTVVATGAVDGNAAANRATKSIANLALGFWKPGQALVLRWSDAPDGGTDDIIGIDDFSFTGGNQVVAPKNLFWDTTNFTTGTWDGAGALSPWTNADAANAQADFAAADETSFGNTAASVTVNVPNNVAPSKVQVTNTTAAGTYTFQGAGQVGGALTKSGAGKLVLANTNAFTSATVTGGVLETTAANATGTGALGIGGATWIVSGAAQTKAGSVNLTGATTIQTDADLTFLTQGATTSVLTKTGNGTLTVGQDFATNTATALHVRAGVFRIQAANAGDAFAAPTIINLNLGAVVDESLGNGDEFGGLVDGPNGGGTYIARATGPAATNGISLLASSDQSFSGRITAGTLGTGLAGVSADPLQRQANLRKEGTGVLTLTGTQSDYQGFTKVNNGTLAFNNINNRGLAGALGIGNGTNGADITIGNGTATAAILRFIGGVSASTDRTVALLGTGTGTNVNSIEVATLGTSLTLNGLINGAGALVKGGAGTLALGAAGGNSYGVSTTVNAGRLLANNLTGSATSSGPVTVNNAALLGGTGSIAGSVALNGTSHLQPGSDGAGTLEVGGNLVMLATTALDVEVGGATPGDGAGNHDQVNVAGTASFNGATLNLAEFGAPGLGADTATLFILSRTGGPADDTFAGLPEGAAVVLGDYSGTITYKANWAGSVGASSVTGGDDVAIVGSAVPEPGTIGLIGLGAVAGLARRRRKNQC